MQYDKNNYIINTEPKNNFININNDVVPAVMPQSKIKKEYIYIGVAIALIIIMNNK